MASSASKSITPQSLITEDHVKKVLKIDKGSDALLKSWKVVDFTKPGDNYSSVVTSVDVMYSKDKKDCEVTYVVKLNSLKRIEGFPDLTPNFFNKEGKFYEELVPALNERLTTSGQKPLGFPKCFLVSLEEGKEQIYFEDLRVRDFKMFDRRKGMDKNHVALVLTELARLHAASYLLKKRDLNEASATETYEFLSQDFLNFFPNAKEVFVPIFQGNVDTGIMMLEKVGGYDTAINWLKKSFKSEVETIISTFMQSERFNSICHGDCWNNNILFRYDNDGRPIEVMLVDLQVSREASLACDLNYFMYTSVTGEVRRPNIDQFLSTYHSSYKAVLESDDVPMYFSKEELLEEFRGKNKVGLVFALSVIPALLMEPSEIPALEDKDIGTLMQELRLIALDKLKTNPLCKPRYLSMFDEFLETGLFS